jgi:hypothetical protein
MTIKQALILAIPVVVSPFCIRSHQFGLMVLMLILIIICTIIGGKK